MQVLKSTKKTPMTVSLAERMLALESCTINDVSIDRDYRDSHALYLMKCMERGKFRYDMVTFYTASCPNKKIGGFDKGTVFRLNGKHTCRAFLTFAAGNKTLQFEGPEIRHYQCDTEEDMRDLFRSLDRGLARTSKDIIVATLGGSIGFETLPKNHMKALVSGLQLWLSGGEYSRATNLLIDDVAEMVKTEYKKLAQNVAHFMNAPGTKGKLLSKIFTRSSVVAALYATVNAVGVQRAADFWNPVKDCIGVTGKGDPRYVLHNFLRDTTVLGFNAKSRNRGKDVVEVIVDTETLYRLCILYWNAWCEHKEIGRRLYTKKDQKRPEPMIPVEELEEVKSN